MQQNNPKRPFPWMIITLIALACLLGWRMVSNAPGAGAAASDATLQVGMMTTPAQESYACNTPELSGQATVYKVMGAKDKLRGLLDRGDCVPVLAPQRFKIVALKDKLAQVSESGAASTSARWVPVRDLVPLAP